MAPRGLTNWVHPRRSAGRFGPRITAIPVPAYCGYRLLELPNPSDAHQLALDKEGRVPNEDDLLLDWVEVLYAAISCDQSMDLCPI